MGNAGFLLSAVAEPRVFSAAQERSGPREAGEDASRRMRPERLRIGFRV